jgi:hypothetical protein
VWVKTVLLDICHQVKATIGTVPAASHVKPRRAASSLQTKAKAKPVLNRHPFELAMSYRQGTWVKSYLLAKHHRRPNSLSAPFGWLTRPPAGARSAFNASCWRGRGVARAVLIFQRWNAHLIFQDARALQATQTTRKGFTRGHFTDTFY